MTTSITGSYNTAIGFGVMADGAGGGASNTGVGQRALQGISTGGSNTSVGAGALQTISTHSNNTAVGKAAGNKINTYYLKEESQ